MEHYVLPEATLPFPGDAWRDHTMNIFRHPQTQASVIITRGRCAPGRNLDEELDAQWQQFQPMTGQLTLSPRESVRLSACPETPARETLCTFVRSGVTYHQWQLALLLPDNISLLVITQTVLNEPGEQDLHYRKKLKQDIQLPR